MKEGARDYRSEGGNEGGKEGSEGRRELGTIGVKERGKE